MPLGTIDRTPPPFFRQGPSAASKLAFFAALALLLMVADLRFRVAQPLRQGLAVVLLPLQRAATVPVDLLRGGGRYLEGLTTAQAEADRLRATLARQAERLARGAALEQENERLRALLEMRPALAVRSLPAEVLYEAADPYSRKLVIDRGLAQGVAPGSPVVNEAGVLGQVTRVYALTAEVTLLADKDAAIPVLNARTQQRGAAFGGGVGGTMELRFVSANADVREGDMLVTGGLDGVYPPGLPVARVLGVERRADSGFARIALAPTAAPDGVRFVLVLQPSGLPMSSRPEATSAPARGTPAARTVP